MLRIWLCLFALLFAPVGGFGFMPSASSGTECAQSCPDDDERGQCDRDCADCTCCGHVRSVALTRPSALPLRHLGAILIEHEEQEPPSAAMGDILHVPIATLA